MSLERPDAIRNETFGPDSLHNGALIPSPGRDLMVKTFGVPPGAQGATTDGWLTPDLPILIRGVARILPIGWWGSDTWSDVRNVPSDIDHFGRCMQDSGMSAAGPWTLMDLNAHRADSIGSYTSALRASGATKVASFVYVLQNVGLAIVWAGREDAGDRSLAVHIVPQEWVFERGVGAPVEGIDVRWSWADVVAIFEADHPHHENSGK